MVLDGLEASLTHSHTHTSADESWFLSSVRESRAESPLCGLVTREAELTCPEGVGGLWGDTCSPSPLSSVSPSLHSQPRLQSQENALHPGKADGFSLFAEILEVSCTSVP